MRKSFVVLSGLLFFAFALITPPSMRADTFQWTVIGPVFSGTGTLDATPDSGNEFTVDDMSGTVVSLLGPTSVTGVLNTGTFLNNDNLLFYPGNGFFDSEFFDSKGLGFSTADGFEVDLSNLGILDAGTAGISGQPVAFQLDLVDISPNAPPPTVTPEPGSLALLGTGILGFAGVVKRKFIRA